MENDELIDLSLLSPKKVPVKHRKVYLDALIEVVTQLRQTNEHFDGCQICYHYPGRSCWASGSFIMHDNDCPMNKLEDLEKELNLTPEYYKEEQT